MNGEGLILWQPVIESILLLPLLAHKTLEIKLVK